METYQHSCLHNSYQHNNHQYSNYPFEYQLQTAAAEYPPLQQHQHQHNNDNQSFALAYGQQPAGDPQYNDNYSQPLASDAHPNYHHQYPGDSHSNHHNNHNNNHHNSHSSNHQNNHNNSHNNHANYSHQQQVAGDACYQQHQLLDLYSSGGVVDNHQYCVCNGHYANLFEQASDDTPAPIALSGYHSCHAHHQGNFGGPAAQAEEPIKTGNNIDSLHTEQLRPTAVPLDPQQQQPQPPQQQHYPSSYPIAAPIGAHHAAPYGTVSSGTYMPGAAAAAAHNGDKNNAYHITAENLYEHATGCHLAPIIGTVDELPESSHSSAGNSNNNNSGNSNNSGGNNGNSSGNNCYPPADPAQLRNSQQQYGADNRHCHHPDLDYHQQHGQRGAPTREVALNKPSACLYMDYAAAGALEQHADCMFAQCAADHAVQQPTAALPVGEQRPSSMMMSQQPLPLRDPRCGSDLMSSGSQQQRIYAGKHEDKFGFGLAQTSGACDAVAVPVVANGARPTLCDNTYARSYHRHQYQQHCQDANYTNGNNYNLHTGNNYNLHNGNNYNLHNGNNFNLHNTNYPLVHNNNNYNLYNNASATYHQQLGQAVSSADSIRQQYKDRSRDSSLSDDDDGRLFAADDTTTTTTTYHHRHNDRKSLVTLRLEHRTMSISTTSEEIGERLLAKKSTSVSKLWSGAVRTTTSRLTTGKAPASIKNNIGNIVVTNSGGKRSSSSSSSGSSSGDSKIITAYNKQSARDVKLNHISTCPSPAQDTTVAGLASAKLKTKTKTVIRSLSDSNDDSKCQFVVANADTMDANSISNGDDDEQKINHSTNAINKSCQIKSTTTTTTTATTSKQQQYNKMSTTIKHFKGETRNQAIMAYHLQATSSNLKANQCDICGRDYARPSTLKTHLRTHTNERPFQCQICQKTFSQAANLTAHHRIHTGERPFSCPVCSRKFSQSSSVITHLRTHSGERPYRCASCSKTFSDSSTLTKHCRIHSGEKPYQCGHCALNFSQSGNLSRHLKLHGIMSTHSKVNTNNANFNNNNTNADIGTNRNVK